MMHLFKQLGVSLKTFDQVYKRSVSSILWKKIGTSILLFSMLLTNVRADLIVPAGSQVNVDAGSFKVPGNITNAGTMTSTTGSIEMTGNWTNTGTYTPNTGTLGFYGSAGTQDFNVEVMNYGSVSHTGASTLQLLGNNLVLTGSITNTAGTFDTNDFDITLGGNWTNTATFDNATNSVILNGADQAFVGSTTFYDLSKTLTAGPARTLTFDNLGEQTISNSLTLSGFDVTNRLLIRSDVADEQHNITLNAGGSQTLAYLDVKDSNATNGLHLAAGSTSANGGNNDNWSFGSATVTWEGDVSSNWTTAGNWDLGFVPTLLDNIIIPDVTGIGNDQPVLSGNISIASLTLQANAAIDLNGRNVTVSDTTTIGTGVNLSLNGSNFTTGTLVNNGTLSLIGSETVDITTHQVTAGTVQYLGSANGAANTFDIYDFGATDYYNLVINDSQGLDTFRTNALDLNVAGALTVTGGILNIDTNSDTLTVVGNTLINGGTITANTGSVDLTGDLTISSGVFTAPNGSASFTLAGDFDHSGGTFTHSSGTLTLDGTDQSILGTSTFYGLVKTVAATATLTFDNTATQTVVNNLVLQGASGQLLNIDSDSVGNQADLTLQAGATQTLEYLHVRDSNAGGGLTLVARSSTEVNGTNTNWNFDGITITWDGSTDTDWDTASNWNLGLVPAINDTAVINDVANDPILATNVTIDALTVDANAILQLVGHNLIVTNAVTNNGFINLYGSETFTVGSINTDAGTVTYLGDNDGVADTFTINDFGAVDYYNLIFNDNNATSDTFVTNGNLTVANTLNVTDGELDISTNHNTLSVASTLTVDGGVLNAVTGNIDANGSVIISAGTLTAPNSSYTFNVAQDFDTSGGGTFVNSSGKVIFDTAAMTTIAGDNTFYSFETTTGGKIFEFTAGSNQTIEGTFNISGQFANEITLRSTIDNTKWTVTFPNSIQASRFVSVKDSDAITNEITVFNGTNNGNNNANWIFKSLSIVVPADGKTVDTTPTIIGIADINETVVIKDGLGTQIATAVADANGNFMVEVADVDALSAGVVELVPYLGLLQGPSNTVTVSANTTTDNVPTITSHSANQRVSVRGATPTILGKGLAGETADIKAYDINGNLLLQTVGTTTVDGNSDYEVTLTTALPKSTNYLCVVVDGVGSDILSIKMTDPFGVVFDSETNNPIQNAVVTIYRSSDNLPATVADGDLDSSDINPITTAADGFYSYITADADYYITVEADGYDYPSVKTLFPNTRTIVTGSKGEQFTVAGVVIEMDQPADANGTLIRVVKDANKSEVRVGEVVTYTVTMENQTDSTITNVFLNDRIPPGFKYLQDRVTLNGVPTANPQGNRPLLFSIGTLSPRELVTVRYQLVVGSGVTYGNYENVAHAQYESGTIISNKATETVKVVLDPIFDLGTLVGKVFFDRNRNGIQDQPIFDLLENKDKIENPVPKVRLAMEDGTVITTDEEGRFSVPGILPGRHLLRLDESTLPPQTFVVNNKVKVIDVTKGSINKINFAIDYVDGTADDQKGTQFFVNKVRVEAKKEQPVARLNVSLFGDFVDVFENAFVDNAEFRIFTNYSALIDTWRLDILDKDTKKIIRSFDGNRANIFDPILWDGKDNNGQYIRLDRNYSYSVVVKDKDGKSDETKEEKIEINVLDKIKDEEEVDEEKLNDKNQQFVRDYLAWIKQEQQKNNIAIQTIPIKGQIVQIDNMNAAMQNVSIYKGNSLISEVPVITKYLTEVTEKVHIDQSVDDKVKYEIILPDGDYRVQVVDSVLNNESFISDINLDQAKSIESENAENINIHTTDIKVGEDYMFFVAMGDAKMGYTFNSGDVEPVAQDDQYNEGYWSEGKMAYYLKGKVKGKYIITSSFDTDRKKKELFRQIDKDKYYPVYGDDSEINYDATNTQGNLYLKIDWDKSSALWGNYAINFDDTEFAKYTRTLYGGKIDFNSLGTTKYGDPNSKVVVFRAQARQKSAHNEFLATGSSLYYLKNKDIIEGSDKIRVQIRDNITGLVLTEKVLIEGADYEMDYEDGTMMFWKPAPMMVRSYSIISDDLLKDNPVYVVADYEYDLKDKYSEATVGTRVSQAVSDNVIVGGTYVKDDKLVNDYILKGTDVKVQLGKDAKVIAEYAETESIEEGSFVSTDGGLSFTELSSDESAVGKAFGIKGDARLFNRFGIASYYKWVDPTFSSSATINQQGKESYGIEGVVDFTESARLIARHDVQKLIDGGTLTTQAQVGAIETSTTLVQVVNQIRKLKTSFEYRRKTITNKIDAFETSTADTEHVAAAKADYQLTDKVGVSVAQQFNLTGERNNITTLGVNAKPTENISIAASKTLGQKGMAAGMNVKVDEQGKINIKGQYNLATDGLGNVTNDGDANASVGATVDLNDKLQLETTVGVDNMFSEDPKRLLTLGGTSHVDDSTTVGSKVILTDSIAARSVGLQLGSDTKLEDGDELNTKLLVTGSPASSETTVSVGGKSKINEKTSTTGELAMTDTSAGAQSTKYSFGSSTQLTSDIQASNMQSFELTGSSKSTANTYSLVKDTEGRKLQGQLTRKFAEGATEASSSNIAGIKGDITDKLSLEGNFERADVDNLDGSKTSRNAVSVISEFKSKDEETGDALTNTLKLEARFDESNENKRQLLIQNNLEGKVTQELSLYGKLEYSKTRNLTTDFTEAEHKEFVLGAAFRPIMHDKLNLLARYTYKENKSPASQTDNADVLEESSHIATTEAVYDINDKWQVSEKLAYKINNEKVTGFDFNRTHTWLVVQRLKYNIDQNWAIAGEFSRLTQREAKDFKNGMLVEASYRVNEFAELGIGYNFTDFNDNMSDLDYTAQGPFIRLTGMMFDRTKEEIERSKKKWLDEKIYRWAWIMIEEEMINDESKILPELNEYFMMAQQAFKQGKYELAKSIYDDILLTGDKMFNEASDYIQGRIQHEYKLKEMKTMADQYFKNGQYEKAKKILEKILEDTK